MNHVNSLNNHFHSLAEKFSTSRARSIFNQIMSLDAIKEFDKQTELILSVSLRHATRSQLKSCAQLMRLIFTHQTYGAMGKYEFKSIEITRLKSSLSVVTDFGSIGDENTALMLHRDHRHIFVGKRGGLRLANGKLKNIVGKRVAYAVTQ